MGIFKWPPFVKEPPKPFGRAVLLPESGQDRLTISEHYAHIGRARAADFLRKDGVDEIAKEIVAKTRLEIVVESDRAMSRSHAMLVWQNGSWNIYDLGSAQGTYINGKKIQPSRLTPIKENDVIQTGSKVFRFTVEYVIKNAALLVGNPGDEYPFFSPLKGVESDLQAMRTALEKRSGFGSNVTTLFRQNATVDAIFRTLEIYEREMSSDATLIVYYSGHGSNSGACTWKSTLKPEELYQALERIRANKLVIMDCCHSFVFLDRIPRNTMVIASESQEGYSYEGEVTQGVAFDLNGNQISITNQGFLSRAIIKFLTENPGETDLKRGIARINEYRRLVRNGQEVKADGHTVYL